MSREPLRKVMIMPKIQRLPNILLTQHWVPANGYRPGKPSPKGFTIFEMLMVLVITAGLMTLVAPALHRMAGPGNITNAAYEVAGVLENARSYATANNTYVWVGFFEEDGARASTFPATAGTGRIVLSTVASRDGTTAYPPSSSQNPDPIDPTKLLQVSKLVKINNAHLANLPAGSGTGTALDARPAVNTMYARYGEINAAKNASAPPTDSQFPFVYPVGNGSTAVQYTFRKTLQFSPRGEAVVNSTYSLRSAVEIGLQPARGNVVNSASRNVAAVQISGVSGNVKIYRR